MTASYLGIDLGGTAVKLGICDAGGRIGARTTIPTEPAKGSDDTITRIAAAARALAGERPCNACGIGAPGELDLERRRLVRGNHVPGWANVQLPAGLAELLGMPVVLENDANCAAWGERSAGIARGARSVACFTLGTGVGGGLVLGDALWVGANGAAASFGHIAVDPHGPPCPCGQRGCVEQYASATSLARRWGHGSAIEVFQAAARGDAAAIAAVEWACDGLAAGVATVIHIVQPEVVVLAGGLARAGDALRDRVRIRVAQRVRGAWLQHIRIETAALGSDAGWIGAALWAAHRATVSRPATNVLTPGVT